MEMLENKKRLYYKPEIVMIVLDNEISLALESGPPELPNEGMNGIVFPEHMKSNPFDNYQA